MKIRNPFRNIALAFACAAMVITFTSATAGEIRGSSGNNFTLTPTGAPGTFTLTHPGVAQVSLLGNCMFEGTETLVMPVSPDMPLTMTGTFRFTSADGTTTLDADVEGVGTPDPANPSFVNLRYRMKFTGGSGKMAGARGKAILHGVAMLTSQTGGTTTFVFEGQLSKHGHE